jgi:hypothetical protein
MLTKQVRQQCGRARGVDQRQPYRARAAPEEGNETGRRWLINATRRWRRLDALM